VINFLIVAFAMFIIVQIYNRFKRKEEKKEEVKQQVEPTQEVVLLTQIRDALTTGRPPVQTPPARQPGD
jgi:large conductance mechanosensitive channel